MPAPGRPTHAARLLVLALAALAAACRSAPAPASDGAPRPGARSDTAGLRRDVAYLASDALEGRGTGTPGNDSAAAYIARRYAELRLAPVIARDSAACAAMHAPGAALEARPGGSRTRVAPASGEPACGMGFLQRFDAHFAISAHAGVAGGLPTQNVVAVLRGSDPRLRGEFVVLGAHFDHLGRATFGALDPERGDAIRNGADDNASGTSAVMELARRLSARPPRRSVLFANFSGEELGLLGSGYFVAHPPVPLDSIVAMLNFDMVGRLRNDKLIVNGVETAAELRGILDSANAAPTLDVRALGGGFGPSDHASFYGKGIPVLHFFTDLHEDYHRATDDADKVNTAGLAHVVDYAERVTRRIADRPSRLNVVRAAAPPPVSSAADGSRPYLGTIPDMSAEVPGVRLTGVNRGSPSDKAGLRAGDVIVEFDGKPVKDLESYSAALYARKPGDTVAIVVLRDGHRVTLEATLAKRGG
jgi:hypothetical protein